MWRCPKCGGPAVRGSRRCEACNYCDFGQLVLTGAGGQTVAANIDTVFGRGALAPAAGGEAGYLSAAQFAVSRDYSRGAWTIRHFPRAENRTWLNGAPLDDRPAVLADGDSIAIGGRWCPLAVRVVHA